MTKRVTIVVEKGLPSGLEDPTLGEGGATEGRFGKLAAVRGVGACPTRSCGTLFSQFVVSIRIPCYVS